MMCNYLHVGHIKLDFSIFPDSVRHEDKLDFSLNEKLGNYQFSFLFVKFIVAGVTEMLAQ